MHLCFDQIEVREAEKGVWSYYGVNRGIAAAARMLDGLGTMHGLQVGVKDIMDSADMLSTYALPINAGHQPA